MMPPRVLASGPKPCGGNKSDWLKNTERVLCKRLEIGSGQRTRFLAQTRRIATSGDENVVDFDPFFCVCFSRFVGCHHNCN